MIDPERCTTMAEVRAGIDQLDQEVVALLAKRFRFIEAAARIKQSRGEVRDERRKAEVIDQVRTHARNAGIPDDLIGRFYDELIESSIAIELARFDTRK